MGEQKPTETESDSESANHGTTQAPIDLNDYVPLTQKGEPLYTLVYQSKNLADGVEASEFAKIANGLRDKLAKKLEGVRFKVMGDRNLPDGKIIAVGRIEGVSDSYFNGMKYSDYRIRENQGHIAFAAFRYSALYVASTHFENAVICHEGDLYVQKTVLGESYTANYQIGDITLGGSNIEGYVISYDAESAEKAKKLRDLIRDTAGYLLAVEENSTAENVISFQKSTDTDGYSIQCENGKMMLAYADVLGQEMLWKHVESFFRNTSSGKALALETLEDDWTSAGGRRMMTYNVLNVWGGLTPGSRDDAAVQAILKHGPDFVCLQEFDVPYRNAANGLISQLSSRYAEVTVDGVDPNHIWNPIFYDKTRYTVLESGWMYFPDTCSDSIESANYPGGGTSDGKSKFRSLVWCVLKDVNDGSIYLIGNLHFSYDDESGKLAQIHESEATAAVNALQSVAARYEGCITLVGGDYNSRRSQSACGLQKMLDAGFKDTYDSAVYKNDYGTTVSNGVPTAGYKTGAIDHVLTLNDLSVHMYLVLTDDALLTASDHLPTVIQFSDKKS